MAKLVPLTFSEIPPEARVTAKGLRRWLEARRARGVPEEGLPAPHLCDESCVLHDRDA